MTQQSQQQQILSLPPLCMGTIWTVSRLAAVWAARRSARCTGAGSCLSGQEDCCEDKESLWGAVAGNLERRSAGASTVVASKRVLNLETGCYGCLRLTFSWIMVCDVWNMKSGARRNIFFVVCLGKDILLQCYVQVWQREFSWKNSVWIRVHIYVLPDSLRHDTYSASTMNMLSSSTTAGHQSANKQRTKLNRA